MGIERAYQCSSLPLISKEEALTLGMLVGIYMATDDELADSAYSTLEQYEASLVKKYSSVTIH